MAIVRHKQPPLRRLMMYGVDHVRQAFASLGELWRNPLASLMTLAVLGVSLALPSCFHVLLKNAEVVEAGVRRDFHKVAAQRGRRFKTEGNELPAFGRNFRHHQIGR